MTVITRGPMVVLRGVVDDLVDSDNLTAVASYSTGVAEVVNEVRVRAINNV